MNLITIHKLSIFFKETIKNTIGSYWELNYSMERPICWITYENDEELTCNGTYPIVCFLHIVEYILKLSDPVMDEGE